MDPRPGETPANQPVQNEASRDVAAQRAAILRVTSDIRQGHVDVGRSGAPNPVYRNRRQQMRAGQRASNPVIDQQADVISGDDDDEAGQKKLKEKAGIVVHNHGGTVVINGQIITDGADGGVSSGKKAPPADQASLSAAPAAVETPVAPVGTSQETKEPVVAPVDGAKQAPTPSTTHSPTPATPEPIKTQFVVAIAEDETQIAKEARQGVDFQIRLGQKGRAKWGPAKVWDGAKNFVAGVWQRNLASPWFREREERWRRDILAHEGISHLPNEVVELAMEKGQEKVDKRSFLRRKTLDAFYNVLSNFSSIVPTTAQYEAKKWLKQQLREARHGNSADPKVVKAYKDSLLAVENFGGQMAQRSEFALTKEAGEKMQDVDRVRDAGLQNGLTEDFFKVFTPYINGVDNEEQALRKLNNYLNEQGVKDDDGNMVSVHERLTRGKYAVSSLTTIGSNMREIAKYLRDRRTDFIAQGFVPGTSTAEEWIAAAGKPDGDPHQLKLTFRLARAEMHGGGRERTLTEKAGSLLERLGGRAENRPVIMSYDRLGNTLAFVRKLGKSIGLNEYVMAGVGGYLGAIAQSTLLPDKSKLTFYGGVLAVMGVPITTAAVGVSLPVAAGLLAGGAGLAGVYAAVKEVARLHKEWHTIEKEVSRGIEKGEKVNRGLFHKMMRGIFGAVDREAIVKRIAHQRAATDIIEGLSTKSGLFEKPEDLTSKIPKDAAIKDEQIQQALHWLLESKVRVDMSKVGNRRFIRYSADSGIESSQDRAIAGLQEEVYERLLYLFQKRPELRAKYFLASEGIASQNADPQEQTNENFKLLYDKLYKAYRHNLLGDEKEFKKFEQLVEVLGDSKTAGFIQEEESLKKRNRAFMGLWMGQGVHRFMGTAVMAVAVGEGLTAAKHIYGGGFDILPHTERTVGPSVSADTTKDIEINGTHLQLPRGFTKTEVPNALDHRTHIVLSNGSGIRVDLNESMMPDGKTLDPIKLQHQLEDSGLHFDGSVQVPGVKPEFSSKMLDTNFHIGNTETHLVLPDNVQVHIQPNQYIDQITINGEVIKFPHPLNPSDLTDLRTLQRSLQDHHLTFKTGANGETIQQLVTKGTAGGKEITLTGNEAWNKLQSPVENRGWYSYDQPGSQLNELRFHTYRDGNSVVLDMTKMQEGYQQGLPNINVAQEIANKNKDLGFYFTLPGDSKHGVFIPDGIGDGKIDGKITLDPNSTYPLTTSDGSQITLGQFTKMVVDQNALAAAKGSVTSNGVDIATELNNQRDVFRVEWIHAGVKRMQDGHAEFDSFATIGGNPRALERVVTGGGGGATNELSRLTLEAQQSTTLTGSPAYLAQRFSIPGVVTDRTTDVSAAVVPLTYVEYAQNGIKSAVNPPQPAKQKSPPHSFAREQSVDTSAVLTPATNQPANNQTATTPTVQPVLQIGGIPTPQPVVQNAGAPNIPQQTLSAVFLQLPPTPPSSVQSFVNQVVVAQQAQATALVAGDPTALQAATSQVAQAIAELNQAATAAAIPGFTAQDPEQQAAKIEEETKLRFAHEGKVRGVVTDIKRTADVHFGNLRDNPHDSEKQDYMSVLEITDAEFERLYGTEEGKKELALRRSYIENAKTNKVYEIIGSTLVGRTLDFDIKQDQSTDSDDVKRKRAMDKRVKDLQNLVKEVSEKDATRAAAAAAVPSTPAVSANAPLAAGTGGPAAQITPPPTPGRIARVTSGLNTLAHRSATQSAQAMQGVMSRLNKLTRRPATQAAEAQAQTPTERQPVLDRKKTYTLRQIFQLILGEVDPSDRDSFVENPPQITLTPEEMHQVEDTRPSYEKFTDNPDGTYTYYYTKSRSKKWTKRRENGSKVGPYKGRFILAAEVAVRAETPEQQAELYSALSDMILQVHEYSFATSDGADTLLERWIEAQKTEESGHSSLDVIMKNELVKKGQLLPYSDRVFYADNQRTQYFGNESWQGRIAELRTALQSGKLKPHHIRWIEYLSQSVDTDALIRIQQDPNRRAGRVKLFTPDQRVQEMQRINDHHVRLQEKYRAIPESNRPRDIYKVLEIAYDRQNILQDFAIEGYDYRFKEVYAGILGITIPQFDEALADPMGREKLAEQIAMYRFMKHGEFFDKNGQSYPGLNDVFDRELRQAFTSGLIDKLQSIERIIRHKVETNQKLQEKINNTYNVSNRKKLYVEALKQLRDDEEVKTALSESAYLTKEEIEAFAQYLGKKELESLTPEREAELYNERIGPLTELYRENIDLIMNYPSQTAPIPSGPLAPLPTATTPPPGEQIEASLGESNEQLDPEIQKVISRVQENIKLLDEYPSGPNPNILKVRAMLMRQIHIIKELSDPNLSQETITEYAIALGMPENDFNRYRSFPDNLNDMAEYIDIDIIAKDETDQDLLARNITPDMGQEYEDKRNLTLSYKRQQLYSLKNSTLQEVRRPN